MHYSILPWLRRGFEPQIESKISFFEVKEPNSRTRRIERYHQRNIPAAQAALDDDVFDFAFEGSGR